MNMIRRIGKKLKEFWDWIPAWAISTDALIYLFLLSFGILVLGLFYKTIEYLYNYDAKCVYVFEDLNGNISEARVCSANIDCKVGDRYYAYKWFEKKCEE